MEALNFDNILGEQEIDTLFTEPEDDTPQEKEPAGENEEEPSEEGKDEKDKTTEVVDSESLFEEEKPESVGSGKNKEDGKEDTVPGEETDGTSPN